MIVISIKDKGKLMAINDENEYENEVGEKWRGVLFLIGAFISGYLVFTLATSYDMGSWVKIIMTLLSSFVGGKLFTSFIRSIETFFLFFLISGISFVLGRLVWVNL